jgi:hypothetical protein
MRKKALVGAICIVILTLASTPSVAGFVGPGPRPFAGGSGYGIPFGNNGYRGYGVPFGGGCSGPFGGSGSGYPGYGGYGVQSGYGVPFGGGCSGPYGVPFGGGYPGYGGYGGQAGYGYPGPLGMPGYSGFGAGNSGLDIGINMPGIGSINLGQFGSGISAGSCI